VDNVPAHHQRDAEAAVLDCDALQLVDDLHIDLVQDRSDPPRRHRSAQVIRNMPHRRLDLGHLADFFLERHAPEEGADLFVEPVQPGGCRRNLDIYQHQKQSRQEAEGDPPPPVG
jgi:hypothetical protein